MLNTSENVGEGLEAISVQTDLFFCKSKTVIKLYLFQRG